MRATWLMLFALAVPSAVFFVIDPMADVPIFLTITARGGEDQSRTPSRAQSWRIARWRGPGSRRSSERATLSRLR